MIRSKTMRPTPVTPKERRELADWLRLVERVRPRRLSECPQSGPCPFAGCRFHLYLDVNPSNGRIKYNFPDCEPDEIPEPCAMRVAMRKGATLEEVGRVLNVTRERARQIQNQAMAKLAQSAGAYRDYSDGVRKV